MRALLLGVILFLAACGAPSRRALEAALIQDGDLPAGYAAGQISDGATKRGRKLSADTIAKLHARRHTEETKQKMSAARKGRAYRAGFTHSKETRQKMSTAQRTTKSTPENRMKVSAESRARWADPEYRARLSASQKAARARRKKQTD